MGKSTPYRAIRASFDDDCITVYQAYSSAIAEAAVASQNLSTSPNFKVTRMSWIKPSWCWISFRMYRCGYSFKNAGQSRVLALQMKHGHFIELLRRACLAAEQHSRGEVVIQWDPERGPRLEKFEYRSIQIGIPASLMQTWVNEWIFSIEDFTEKARGLKKKLEEDTNVSEEELVRLSLKPEERLYEVPIEIMTRLKMDSRPGEEDI